MYRPGCCAAGRRGSLPAGGRIEVGGGERELGQAESIGGIGFLGGDHAASGPLVSAIAAREDNGADNSVTVHDGAPHVKAEAAIASLHVDGCNQGSP